MAFIGNGMKIRPFPMNVLQSFNFGIIKCFYKKAKYINFKKQSLKPP